LKFLIFNNSFAESDNFIKKHLEILEASESNKNKQNLQLGIFRNDFMMDKFKDFIYQVEINTIASSMGFFSDSLLNFNKHFLKKYRDLYKKFHAMEGEGVLTYQGIKISITLLSSVQQSRGDSYNR